MDTEKIQAYWNQLNARERIELFKKVTGIKMEVIQVVNMVYPPKDIEEFLDSHPDEIQPKFQPFMRENSEAKWAEISKSTFDRKFAEYIADKQLKVFSAFAIAVVNTLTGKLVYINY